jgi:hypothetical protein
MYSYSLLAQCGGRGMSFNICRGAFGSLAKFIAIRRASSRVNRFVVDRHCNSSKLFTA